MCSTLDGAKRCAKQMKSILDSSDIIFPLARCQGAVAKADIVTGTNSPSRFLA